MPKVKANPKIETRLSPVDMERFNSIAASLKRSRSDLAREAIRWYISRHDEIQGQSREGEMAQALRYATDQLVQANNLGVDRLCKMLARQSRAIATLYELSWMSLPDSEYARKAFETAAQRAKERIAKHLESDERELAERMRNVVKQ